MNVLFLTIGSFGDIEQHGIYADLLRCFRDNGHSVYVVSAREKRDNLRTEICNNHGADLLFVKIGNITKCGMIEKGISTLTIEGKYKKAIKKYFSGVKFDLIIYSTPPITLAGVIEYVKKRDNAFTYLLLKDIFPQNAVDLGILKNTGIKGVLYKYFRNKEKTLYRISDAIGCMSQGNCKYISEHNSEVSSKKINVCPNSINPVNMGITESKKINIREKYGLPKNKKIFVYGGNLGKPQDVPFIIECLKACRTISDALFVIAGAGTQRHFLEDFINKDGPENIKLFDQMPKDEYDKMIACCDVGLIFLDHRFTIPNFPSRLLAYMQANLPIIACTDKNTDIGNVILNGKFGFWCESNSASDFKKKVEKAMASDLRSMGEKSYQYLLEHYTVEESYNTIISSLK